MENWPNRGWWWFFAKVTSNSLLDSSHMLMGGEDFPHLWLKDECANL